VGGFLPAHIRHFETDRESVHSSIWRSAADPRDRATLRLRGRRRRVQNAIRLVRYRIKGWDSTAETLFTFTTPRSPS
jgi:hypothetical protein